MSLLFLSGSGASDSTSEGLGHGLLAGRQVIHPLFLWLSSHLLSKYRIITYYLPYYHLSLFIITFLLSLHHSIQPLANCYSLLILFQVSVGQTDQPTEQLGQTSSAENIKFPRRYSGVSAVLLGGYE
jgi:hypothetical protein